MKAHRLLPLAALASLLAACSDTAPTDPELAAPLLSDSGVSTRLGDDPLLSSEEPEGEGETQRGGLMFGSGN